MPLGTEVALGLGDTVLDGTQLSPKGAQPPNLRPMSIVAKRSPTSAIDREFVTSAKKIREF